MLKASTTPTKIFSSGWFALLLILICSMMATRWYAPNGLNSGWRNLIFSSLHDARPMSEESNQAIVFIDTGELSLGDSLTVLSSRWQQPPQSIIWLGAGDQALPADDLAVMPIVDRNNLGQFAELPQTVTAIAPATPWYSLLSYRSAPLTQQISWSETNNDPFKFVVLHGLSSNRTEPVEFAAYSRTALIYPMAFDWSVWSPVANSQMTLESVEDYSSSRLPKLLVLGSSNSTSITEMANQYRLLTQQQFAADWPFFDILLFALMVAALVCFKWVFLVRYWISAGVVLTLVAGLMAWQYWLISHHRLWLPVIEGSVILIAMLVLAWLEKHHQHRWQVLFTQHQQWGTTLANQFQQNAEFEQAFATIQSLQPQTDVLEQTYQLALECEDKRELGLAKEIYAWLTSAQQDFKDCAQRQSQLSDTHSAGQLSQTVALDGTVATPADINMPKQLGRYQIEGVLGRGAMGVVYRGIDPAINRDVAIKTMALSREFEQQDLQIARERFFREAETAGRLSHPHIVTIYDVGEQQDLAFIAMDLLTGSPLDQHVKAGTLLPVPVVYQLMIQVTSALDYAHRGGVVHRDIKPANLVYDDDNRRVIVTDFGIAHLSDHSKTRTGAILGSPYYMSPEQVQGERVDGRSDIFSLGVTFYQLLTGELPFKGESLATVALNICSQKHTPVRSVRPDLPTSASRIINKALQKDKQKRYAAVVEMRDALTNALKRDFKMEPFSS